MPQQQEGPPRAVPADDNGYFEVLTKAVFQAGFSWRVIESKWPAFRTAFAEFDVTKVAAFGPADEERLLADTGIVRNGRKIVATIANAQAVEHLRSHHGTITNWLAESADLPWPDRKKVVAAPFSGVGPSGAYFFLWSVGEATPPHEEEATWTDPVPSSHGLSG